MDKVEHSPDLMSPKTTRKLLSCDFAVFLLAHNLVWLFCSESVADSCLVPKEELHLLYQVLVCFLVHDIGQFVDEVSEVGLEEYVEILVVLKTRELSIFFSKKTQLRSLASQQVVHANEKTLFLDLLDSHEYVVVVGHLQALRMNDELVLTSLVVEAKLNLAQRDKVVEGHHKRVRLGGVLNAQSDLGIVAHLVDSAVNALESFVKG